MNPLFKDILSQSPLTSNTMNDKQTAVDFANWISDKGYWAFLPNNRHWMGEDRVKVADTTDELFEIFLNERS